MAKVNMPGTEDLPNNSNRARREKEEQKKKDIKPIAKAITKKKSVGKKFAEAFIGDESEHDNIKDYILYDVLIPAAKNTISDAITGGLEMLLFGERRSSSSRMNRDRGKSYVNYSGYSKRQDIQPERFRRNARERVWNDDIILDSRGEAEQVIDSLLDIIDQYGAATVADLYGLVGIDSEYTDNKYGWTNLSSANVSRTRDGYILNLPKAYPID